jgi:hypothetical protein
LAIALQDAKSTLYTWENSYTKYRHENDALMRTAFLKEETILLKSLREKLEPFIIKGDTISNDLEPLLEEHQELKKQNLKSYIK